MPTPLHEAIIDIFRDDPTLAATLLREVLHLDLPTHARIETAETNLNNLVPAEFRVDQLQILRGTRDEALAAILLEVQLRRDPSKLYSWPCYGTATRARHCCDTYVLVVTPDAKVARWARAAIRLGGRSVFQVEVLGPDELPRPTVEAARARPHLALLCTLAHAHTPADAPLVRDILTAFGEVASAKAVEYHHLVLASIDEACRLAVEQLMKPVTADTMMPIFKPAYEKGLLEGHDKGLLEGREEGREEGRALSVLAVLQTRGLVVTAEQRAMVLACTDGDRLDAWLRRAVVARTTEEALAIEQ